MGYDESQFSLPRWMDISISRQTVYVNTYSKIPSQARNQTEYSLYQV